MKFSFFVLISFLFGVALAADDSKVLELTGATFQKTIDEADTIAVAFTAPWCGHCKSLKPAWASASIELAKEDPPILLANVDATIETELAQKYEVQGYPTIKLFRKGTPSEYGGPRDAKGIAKYLRAQAGPAAKSLSSAAAYDKFTTDVEDVRVVAFVEEGTEAETTFLAVAEQLREEFRFAVVTDAAVAKSAGATVPSLIALRPKSFETVQETLELAEQTVDQVKKAVYAAGVPLAGVYSRDNAKLYDAMGVPRITVWSGADQSKRAKQIKYYINRLRKVAKEFVGKLTFVLEEKDTAPQFKDLNFDASADFGLGAVGAAGEKFKAPAGKFSVDALRAFAQSVVDGSAEQFVKSEDIPAEQGDVTVVVGKTFDELVTSADKDVLIEFYAPWCGHCKTLAPKWDKLGKRMAKYSDTLTIAKIDATANDYPKTYDVTGFPTIFLKKATGELVRYNGQREVKDFQKFLKANVSKKLVAKKDNKDEL